MLTKEPLQRATLSNVAKHAWFNGEVTQPVEFKRITVSEHDIDNAIGVAKWTSPAAGVSHDDDD